MTKEFKTYPELKDTLLNNAKRWHVTIDIDNPKTIQDKINWLKLYDSTPEKTRCADKIELRGYCKERLGVDLCPKIIKIYESVKDIVWDELPKQFVIKCNHGSGMNIVVKDKDNLDTRNAEMFLLISMGRDFSSCIGCEMQYLNIPHKIFVEELLQDEKQPEKPFEYKFWCSNGDLKFYTVNLNFKKEKAYNVSSSRYYWPDGEEFDPYMVHTNSLNEKIELPVNFEKMKEYAKILSSGFKLVRVDMYEVNGTVYLGELTFTPGAGFQIFTDKRYDEILGNLFDVVS